MQTKRDAATVIEFSLCDKIDFAFLLYVYMICADGQEHIYEVRALNKLMDNEGVSDKTKKEVAKIISQDDNLISIYDVIDAVPAKLHLQCIKNLTAFAYVDGYCDPLERNILELVAEKWGISPKELNVFCAEGENIWAYLTEPNEHLDYSQNYDLGEKIVLGADKLVNGHLLKFMKTIQLETVKEKIKNLEKKILLSGPDYDKAIEECRLVAEEDIAFAAPLLESTQEALNGLKESLNKAMSNSKKSAQRSSAKTAKDVVKFLQETERFLKDEILRNLEKVNASLHKKRRAMKYFTISFLGKTKAGKSTLHAVITGEGEDAIGAGKQRTTRLNRVYEWKNIRIIDTPGIGAPGGKTDEEIAESVVDESDLICFVLNNNNQQETEFSFLKKLKAKAKPLLILLNVKENLDQPRKLERFLQAPDKLFSIGDKKALGGHFDRIKNYAEKHYGNAYFDIVPVQIYAALLSRKEEFQDKQHKLLKASRLQKFLDSLKVTLINDGVIRRSQTLLGCTVGEIEPVVSWARKKSDELDKYYSQFNYHRKTSKEKIKAFAAQSRKELEQEFSKVFDNLRDTIPDFAENNWESKKCQIKDNWIEHVGKDFKIKQRLEAALHKSVNSYSNDIQELLEEIGQDISLIAKIESPECDLQEQDSSTYMKNFMRIGGSFLGLASSGIFTYLLFSTGAANFWNPLGWGLMISGLAMGLLSGFISSKAEKMRKAINNISQKLCESINKQERNILNSTLEDWKKHTDSVEKEIENYFSILEKGLKAFAKELKKSLNEIESIQNDLNKVYAKRVIDWVTGNNEPLTSDAVEKAILSVEREIGAKLIITVKDMIKAKRTEQETKSVLQENLIIKGG